MPFGKYSPGPPDMSRCAELARQAERRRAAEAAAKRKKERIEETKKLATEIAGDMVSALRAEMEKETTTLKAQLVEARAENAEKGTQIKALAEKVATLELENSLLKDTKREEPAGDRMAVLEQLVLSLQQQLQALDGGSSYAGSELSEKETI